MSVASPCPSPVVDTAAPAKAYRIVQVIDGLGRGGAELLLTAYAAELKRLGHDVQVVVLKEKDGNLMAEPLIAAGIPVHLVTVEKMRKLGQMKTVVDFIRRLKPDIVHAHLQFANVIAGAVGRLHGIPTVSTLHTLEGPAGFSKAGLRMRIMNHMLAGSVDRVICLSQVSAVAARRHGLARANIAILGNGIDLSPYDRPPAQSRAALRQSLGVAPDAKVIITVAVLRPEKGIDRLIKALPAILRDCPEAHLLVVGDGAELVALRALAEALGVAGRVTFAGFRRDVPDLMRIADLFVLPTLGDALPTVVMEAMAASLPVVASNVGGLPEMVTQDRHGTLVPPDDVAALAGAVRRWLTDPAARATAGKAARQKAERDFTLQGQVQKLVQIYDRVIAERHRVS